MFLYLEDRNKDYKRFGVLCDCMLGLSTSSNQMIILYHNNSTKWAPCQSKLFHCWECLNVTRENIWAILGSAQAVQQSAIKFRSSVPREYTHWQNTYTPSQCVKKSMLKKCQGKTQLTCSVLGSKEVDILQILPSAILSKNYRRKWSLFRSLRWRGWHVWLWSKLFQYQIRHYVLVWEGW